MYHKCAYTTLFANLFNSKHSTEDKIGSFVVLATEELKLSDGEPMDKLLTAVQAFIPKDEALRPKAEVVTKEEITAGKWEKGTKHPYILTPMTKYLKNILCLLIDDKEELDFIGDAEEIGVIDFDSLSIHYPYSLLTYYTKNGKLHMLTITDTELSESQIEYVLSRMQDRHVEYLNNLANGQA